MWTQAFGRAFERFGQHLHVGEHGHEARVAVPARDDVQVHVILDPGARDAAEVPAEVVPVRRVLGAERLDAARAQAMHLERLLVGEEAEVAEVAVRCDEQMPGGVGELVQHDQRMLAAMHEQLLLGLAEDAAVELVGLLDVLEAPRRPQRLRHRAEGNYRAPVETKTLRNEDGTFDIVQRAPAAASLSSEDLQRLYWREVASSTLGVVRFSRGAIRVLGIWPRLLEFGPSVEGRRLIVGGIFARHPYGAIAWWARDGEIVVSRRAVRAPVARLALPRRALVPRPRRPAVPRASLPGES